MVLGASMAKRGHAACSADFDTPAFLGYFFIAVPMGSWRTYESLSNGTKNSLFDPEVANLPCSTSAKRNPDLLFHVVSEHRTKGGWEQARCPRPSASIKREKTLEPKIDPKIALYFRPKTVSLRFCWHPYMASPDFLHGVLELVGW
jgi:hypothetical protein